MKWKGMDLAWDTPMPPNPIRQHHESATTGDNKGCIRRAANDTKALDVNITRLAGRNWCLHNTTPGKNGYTRVMKPNGHTRKMTWPERLRHGDKWGYDGIKSWRRPNGEQPLTERAGVEYCLAKGVLPIRELKSPSMATSTDAADESRRVSVRYGCPGWFKTLYNMSGPRGKCVMYQSRELSVALIFGKHIAGRARRLAAAKRITSTWGRVRPDAVW